MNYFVDNLHYLVDNISTIDIDYIIFGIIDNLVMIIGAITGCELEKYLPKRLQVKGVGTVIGAGLGNALSDWLGGVGAGNWAMANQTALGCILALAFIPVILRVAKYFRVQQDDFK
jgi:hypothetical protein